MLYNAEAIFYLELGLLETYLILEDLSELDKTTQNVVKVFMTENMKDIMRRVYD